MLRHGSPAVDERLNSAGVGSGNVYVVIVEFNFDAQTNTVMLASSSTTLVCAAPVLVSGSNTAAGFADVQVRSDGLITVSFSNANADGSADILFTTCTPAAAPSAPVCGSPTTVTHVAHPLSPSITISVPMVNITPPVVTFRNMPTEPIPAAVSRRSSLMRTVRAFLRARLVWMRKW